MKKIVNVLNENIDLKIKDDTTINIINDQVNLIKIELSSKIKVIINDFRIINQSNKTIDITVASNSTLIYNHSFINESKYDLIINTIYKGTGAEIIINTHGLNNKGNSDITINGEMGDNFSNTLLENIKLININGGSGSIVPNIIVSNSQVIANHKATIGSVSKDSLSYLMSKGITKKESLNLILSGFLINIYKDKEFITKAKEIIIWSE